MIKILKKHNDRVKFELYKSAGLSTLYLGLFVQGLVLWGIF
jgi:hypothetical protein